MSMWDDAMCIEDKYDQYEEDIPTKPRYQYPKDVIEETEDIDFAIYILVDRCKHLSRKGALFSKIDRCIKHLKFLKEIDEKYEWLSRDNAMLQCTLEEVSKENGEPHKRIEEHNKINGLYEEEEGYVCSICGTRYYNDSDHECPDPD